ncbi:MAG: ATP-binding protein [Epulopiscium sp.]|nr:ATP-binding protein [Candidatus Epulonipiscium sp.]
MKELSLHILDIIENSIRAKATDIKLEIIEDLENNLFEIKIEDNGKGMDEAFAKAIKDPFTTTRTTRKVGLGVPLLVAACNRCNGDVEIQSALGEGTKLRAWMEYHHIDRAPLGDIVSTITNLILSNPDIEFIYIHRYNDRVFRIDTQEIKDILGDVPINELSVIVWIKEYLTENLTEIRQKP